MDRFVNFLDLEVKIKEYIRNQEQLDAQGVNEDGSVWIQNWTLTVAAFEAANNRQATRSGVRSD